MEGGGVVLHSEKSASLQLNVDLHVETDGCT